MSTRYNTGNPIESTDVRDMSDNAQNLDLFSLSNDDSFKDRLGNERKTLNGAVKDIGIPIIGDFTTGCTVTNVNQGVQEIGGSVYRWKGVLPKIVPPSSTPSGTGGISPSGDWVDVGDASAYARIINELSQSDGVNLVGGAAKQSDLDSLGVTVDYVVENISPIATKNLVAASIANALRNGIAQKAASYGDSTGFGYEAFAPLITDQVAIPPTLALQNLMSQLQLPLTVFNRCISGTSLASMIDGTDGSGSTFAEKVGVGGIDHDADIIYCNHAINDSAANSDIVQFRSNLVKFVSLCRENGIVPVLVTPNPNPPAFSVTEDRSRRLVMFAEMTRSVAIEYSVDLVDQYYFFEKSQKVEVMVSMVPDGIHPSETMYVRTGQNLAIPLISSLLSMDDVNGITGISYKDNLTSRSISGLGGRLGLTISATRGTQPQAMHIPVLFNEAASGFSVYGSESAGEDKVNVQLNGFTIGVFTDTKTLGDTSYVDNDYRYMVKAGVHAGLQLITLIYDPVASPGNRLTFSGISLSPDQFQQITGNTNGSSSKLNPILSGYTAITMAKLDATNELVFTDRNNSPVVKIKNVSNVFTVETVANGSVVSTQTAGGFFPDGIYPVEMVVSDTSVIIAAGSAGVTIPLTRKLPALFLYTKALICNVL